MSASAEALNAEPRRIAIRGMPYLLPSFVSDVAPRDAANAPIDAANASYSACAFSSSAFASSACFEIRLEPAEDLERLLSALDILFEETEGVFLLPPRELLKCGATGFNLLGHYRS